MLSFEDIILFVKPYAFRPDHRSTGKYTSTSYF